MSDVYYSPAKFGLTTVGEIDWSTGCYEFDLTVVWRDNRTGSLMWAEDSGCSCPSPFDSVGIDDMTTGTWMDLKAHLDYRNGKGYDGPRDEQIADLMSRVVA